MAGLRNLVLGAGLLAAGCGGEGSQDQGAASVDELKAAAAHLDEVRKSTGITIERAGFGWDAPESANYGNVHPKFEVKAEPDAGVIADGALDGGVAVDAGMDAEPDTGAKPRPDERYVIKVDPHTEPFSADSVDITSGKEKIDCRFVAFPPDQNEGLEAYSCLVYEPTVGVEYPIEGLFVVAQRELVRMQLSTFPKGTPDEKVLHESLDLTAQGCQDTIRGISLDAEKCESLFHQLVDAIQGMVALQPTPEMTMAYEYYKNLLELIKGFSTGTQTPPSNNKFFTQEPVNQDEKLGPEIVMSNGDRLQCSVDERFLATGHDVNGDLTGEWKIVELNCFLQSGNDLLDIRMKFNNVVEEDFGIRIEVSKNGSMAASMDVTGQHCSFRLDNGTPLPTFASVQGSSPCGDLLSQFRHFTSEVSHVPLSKQ